MRSQLTAVKESDGIEIGAAKTRMGWVAYAWTRRGLLSNSFFHTTRKDAESELREMLDTSGSAGGEPDWIGQFFEAYSAGDKKRARGILESDAKFDLSRETPHRRKVFRALLKISWGKVKTYGGIARSLGSGARAVGGACGANRCPVIIPCHRVIAADGSLGGFGGGLDAKRLLLKHEGYTCD